MGVGVGEEGLEVLVRFEVGWERKTGRKSEWEGEGERRRGKGEGKVARIDEERGGSKDERGGEWEPKKEGVIGIRRTSRIQGDVVNEGRSVK